VDGGGGGLKENSATPKRVSTRLTHAKMFAQNTDSMKQLRLLIIILVQIVLSDNLIEAKLELTVHNMMQLCKFSTIWLS
jgi:hypothetical protein